MKGVRSSGRLSLACVGALLAFAACEEEKQDATENYNAPTPVVVTVRIKDPSDVARLTYGQAHHLFFLQGVRKGNREESGIKNQGRKAGQGRKNQ